MKYEPRVSSFTTKFWIFLWSKSAHTRKNCCLFNFNVNIASFKGQKCLEICAWNTDGKKLHTELKTNILAGSQATIKPVASLLQVQKYFSRNWSYILPLSLLVNGPFLVSGFA